MKLGICLSGVEEQFERALRLRVMDDQPFVFMEIGVAGCDTFLSVCQILAESESRWRAIAIDPSECARIAYVARIKDKLHTTFLHGTRHEAFEHPELIGNRLDFVFIDGCHSQKCVMCDFLAVKPLVVQGGLVVFHDVDQPPGEIQPHCNTGQDVKGALEELGLWQDTRSGWKRLPDWTADRTKNAFSCAVFEKL